MSPAGARLTIDGMVCGACTSAVTSALQKVGGVRSVSVSLETKSATVRYDSGATGLDSLRTAVETCGFDVLSVVPTDADPSPVPTRLVTLAIGGMTCARCSDWVTRALEDLQGVQQVSVDLKTHKALVRCAVGGASLVRCVAGTGYTARLLRVDDVAEDEVQNTTTGSYVQQQNTTVPYVTDEGFDDSEALFSGTETSFSDAAASSSSRDGAGASNVITLRVSGMSCASCASKVEEAALSCPGVVSATVNLLAETATVTLSLGDAPGESGHQNKRRNNNTTTHWATPDPETVARFVTNYGFPSEVVDATGLAFRVGGMVCASCPPRIEMALGRLKGVTKVEANELLGKVLVKYNAAQIGARTLMRAIEKLEYAPVELWEDDSALTGTSTGHQKEAARYKKEFLLSCVFAVPLFLLMMVLDKIEVFHAALMTDCLGGAAAPGMLPVMSLLSFFLATPVQFGLGKQFYVRAYRAVKHGGANMDLLVALGTSAAYAYSTYVVLAGIAAPALVKGSAQFYETSAVLIAFVLMGKWLEARAKGATSNAIRVLVALQPTTARIVEMPGDGSVASHLADVAAKRAKELTSKGSVTSDDFEDFEETHDAFVELATAAATAAAVSSGAGERQVDTALLQRGDVLCVTPGGRFPADGLVISGHTSADESALTGESMPVTKIPGQFVIGGTINAGGGSPLVLATNVGADAMLAKVVRLIEDAQVAKAPIQAYADKVSGVFVPFVVFVATVTWISWFVCARSGYVPVEWFAAEGDFLFSFLFAITVLVIACPCALGLATPTAVMVGTGLGAKYGILIKGGKPLETAHGASHIIFDKTGTITVGKPAVTNIVTLDGVGGVFSQDDILQFAASAEVSSEHPVGKAMVVAARKGWGEENNGTKSTKSRRIDLLATDSFEARAGMGVAASLRNGCLVTLGNVRFMHESGVVVSGSLLEIIRREEEKGQTVVVVHVANTGTAGGKESLQRGGKSEKKNPPVGLVCVSDPIRPEAKEAIAALTSRGVTTSIVSGDNWRVARAVAAQVGIQTVVAEALPGDKVTAVKDAQRDARAFAKRFGKQTGAVLVVGDGINDAPAMAQADLGIAIGAGTDVAMEAAGVVLVKSNLLDVVAALDISRVVFGKIKLNLFFSLAYNVVGIPVAAGALYPLIKMRLPPELAALAMALSSVSVVLSSLMLTRYRPPIGSFASDALKKRNAILAAVDFSIGEQKTKRQTDQQGAQGSINVALSEIQLVDGGGVYAVGLTPM